MSMSCPGCDCEPVGYAPHNHDPRPFLCRIGDHEWTYADDTYTTQVCPRCGATRELEDWWI